MGPRISVVVPAYNEELLLPRLLDTVEVARRRHEEARASEAPETDGARGVEVIVADNGSTDRTAELAAERGATIVPVSKRAIAAARNGGARAAKGEVIAFVDADLQVHPDAFIAIDRVMRRDTVVGGATSMTMERWSVGIRTTYHLSKWMVRAMGLEGGVVFLRRDDFELLGGYPEDKRYAEDVGFLFGLKRLGRERGQRFVVPPDVEAIASTRKFDEQGDWHMMTFPVRYGWRKLTGTADRLVDEYWYTSR